ncbi:bidirectional sugar transporter SWEET2a-like protein [Cinnamomum micranthum f. kanehirae]|uniref:Bidirectional sugar transporter SWEET2a-like protein n=1 Tax=Cinnamomum micranthum f. kanehirae TaxID=337451 RepID=A0A443NDN0_9MAGN|nr:bidirectional sugar transporter SWEET2a-like protein [Cinnamomum micranthum f. kanehirae]
MGALTFISEPINSMTCEWGHMKEYLDEPASQSIRGQMSILGLLLWDQIAATQRFFKFSILVYFTSNEKMEPALSILRIPEYGLPMISPNIILVATLNCTGASFQLIYKIIFIIYVKKVKKGRLSPLNLPVTFSSNSLGFLFAWFCYSFSPNIVGRSQMRLELFGNRRNCIICLLLQQRINRSLHCFLPLDIRTYSIEHEFIACTKFFKPINESYDRRVLIIGGKPRMLISAVMPV